MLNNEYTDFKFGNYWASDFGLVMVSSSDRYSPPVFGKFNPNTASLAGKTGVYKWRTQKQEKVMSISIAYDHVLVEQVPYIKQWLNPMEVHKLILSDEPYKFYYAVLEQDVSMSFLPFLEDTITTPHADFQEGVLKGEIVLNFILLDNEGYSNYESFNNPNLVYFPYSMAGAEQVPDLQKYEDFVTIEEMRGNILNVDNKTNYVFSAEHLYEDMNYDFDEKDKHDFQQLLSDAVNANAGGDNGNYKPWVRTSNLLDNGIVGESHNIYNDNNIYSTSIYGKLTEPMSNVVYIPNFQLSTQTPIYLMNSGNERANLDISCDIPTTFPVQIAIKKAKIKPTSSFANGLEWNYDSEVRTIEITDFTNYRPYQDFLTAIKNDIANCRFLISGKYCEVWIVHIPSGTKVNLSRFNTQQVFPLLDSCKIVDYLKPFPTFNIAIQSKDSALNRTIFNCLTVNNNLQNVNLEWKHTYL